MTEEVKIETAPEEKKYSPVEEKALAMGWRPLEEFNGDEADFIDAKEFVNRKPLFEKIEHQSKEVKNLRRALDAFKEHNSKIEETAYKKALADLKATQKKALVDGDVDKFYELDEEIEATKQEAAELRQSRAAIDVSEPAPAHPEFAAWSHRNPWYEAQPHMRTYADNVGRTLAGQGLSPSEVLKKVEEAVHKEFPQKFRNPNKDSALSEVESGTRGSGTRTRESHIEMTDQERTIMNTLVKGGHLTKEQYIKQLKEAKGLV